MTQPDAYILRVLRAQAHQLTHEIGRLGPEIALWKPDPNEWSVHECLCHIRNAERHVFLLRIQRMSREDNPQLALFDEQTYQKEHYNKDEPLEAIVADFLTDRAAEVALLETTDWSRTGIHPTRGQITIGWMADYAVGHLWEHLSQAMRVRLSYATKK